MKSVPINIHSGSKRKDRPNGGFYVEENPSTTKALDAAGGLNPACCQGGTIVAMQDTTTREKAQNGRGWSEDGTSYTLDAAATQGVAIAFQQNTRNEVRMMNGDGQIAGALQAEAGMKQQNYLATGCMTPELPQRVRVHGTGGTSPTLSSEEGRGHGAPTVLAVDTYNQTTNETSQAINSSASDINHTGGVINPAERMAVRRLTPRECERLQGFPDDHTLIPWRGKSPQDCPDGPRYKALGNSMAVPCMAWIGRRIAAQEMFPLRYLSVCSGIEAASVAWEPLGWQPAAFSEVEKFPSAVLAHHWPDVPNLGDMTQYEQWKELGAIDLLVGGTPCQSFSVAGLRQGLRDPRGGLMLTYLEIARSFGPRWLVWENVPGVLSSHGGRDFGAFLGALGALGYGFAYRVLDAQWFGVAQRRRRVFVVGHLGDWTAAAKVLFERESVRRNPAPSREKGQGAAADARASAEAGGGSEPVGALDCRIGAQRAQNAQAGHYIAATTEGCDLFNHAVTGSVAHSIRVGNGNAMGGVPSVVGALSDGAHQGGGLTDKMPTLAAYLPALANPLTARMGKGINTTLDEGQTPIVCQGEGRNDL